jgi:hypothetical protein
LHVDDPQRRVRIVPLAVDNAPAVGRLPAREADVLVAVGAHPQGPLLMSSTARSAERTHSRCQRSTVAGLPASARRSTEATSVAGSATTDVQRSASAHSNEPAQPTGDAEQASRAAGLDASTGRIGSQRPYGRRDTSREEWPTIAPTSTGSCPDAVLARHRPQSRTRARRDPPIPWESGALASARSAGMG